MTKIKVEQKQTDVLAQVNLDFSNEDAGWWKGTVVGLDGFEGHAGLKLCVWKLNN